MALCLSGIPHVRSLIATAALFSVYCGQALTQESNATIQEVLEAASASGPHFYRLRYSSVNPLPLLGRIESIPDDQSELVDFVSCSGEEIRVEFSALQASGASCDYERDFFRLSVNAFFSSESLIYADFSDEGLQPVARLSSPMISAVLQEENSYLSATFTPIAHPGASIQWDFPLNSYDFVFFDSGGISLIARDPEDTRLMLQAIRSLDAATQWQE